jgi:hypothetical protein
MVGSLVTKVTSADPSLGWEALAETYEMLSGSLRLKKALQATSWEQ